MDFVILMKSEEATSILSAWRQQIISHQQNIAYETLDRHLNRLLLLIKKASIETINLDPPDDPIKSEEACKLLADAVTQVVLDLVENTLAYDGFPSDRKNQLVWLTWNLMFYEQLANYLFEKKICLPPFKVNLPVNDELICRYVRNQVYDKQYSDIIKDDYSGHTQEAEIRLESVNDSIEVLTKLQDCFEVSNELAHLYIERIRILLGLGRKEEAVKTNEDAKSLLSKHQSGTDYFKVLEQEA